MSRWIERRTQRKVTATILNGMAVGIVLMGGAALGETESPTRGPTRGAPVLGTEWLNCEYQEVFRHRCVRLFQVYEHGGTQELANQRIVYEPPVVLVPNDAGEFFSVLADGVSLAGRIAWDPHRMETFHAICNYLMTQGPNGGPVAEILGDGDNQSFQMGRSQVQPISVVWAEIRSDSRYGLRANITDGEEYRFAETGEVPFVLSGESSKKTEEFLSDFQEGHAALRLNYSFYTFDTKTGSVEIKGAIQRQLRDMLDLTGEAEGALRTTFISRKQMADLVNEVSTSLHTRAVYEQGKPDTGFLGSIISDTVTRLIEEQAKGDRTLKDVGWDRNSFTAHITNYSGQIRNETDQMRVLTEIRRLMANTDEHDYRAMHQSWVDISGLFGGGTGTSGKAAWASGESEAQAITLLKDALRASAEQAVFTGAWYASPSMDLYRVDEETLSSVIDVVNEITEVNVRKRAFFLTLNRRTIQGPGRPPRHSCPRIGERALSEGELRARAEREASERAKRRQENIESIIRRSINRGGCPTADSFCVPAEEWTEKWSGRKEFDWLVVPNGSRLTVRVPAGKSLEIIASRVILGGRLDIRAGGGDAGDGGDGRDGRDRPSKKGSGGSGGRGGHGGNGGHGSAGYPISLSLGIVSNAIGPTLGLPNFETQLERIRIRTYGGDGGRGGDGGDGGRGGSAGCLLEGYESAGRGGAGGKGGNGGAGGNGGNLRVKLWKVTPYGTGPQPSQTLTRLVRAYTGGGSGGHGGDRGRGGRGGRDWTCRVYLGPIEIDVFDMDPGRAGPNGADGSRGTKGRDGKKEISIISAPRPSRIKCEWDWLGSDPRIRTRAQMRKACP